MLIPQQRFAPAVEHLRLVQLPGLVHCSLEMLSAIRLLEEHQPPDGKLPIRHAGCFDAMLENYWPCNVVMANSIAIYHDNKIVAQMPVSLPALGLLHI
jgi:hypothetical protein